MISTIILAAGDSSRLGDANKLLLPFRGRTLVEWTVDTLLAAAVDEVIVVLGFDSDRVREALGKREVTIVDNPYWEDGLMSSVWAGVNAAHEETSGFMFCPADLPRLEAEDYNQIMGRFGSSRDRDAVVAPVFQDDLGYPLIFAKSYRSQILNHPGDDGLNDLLNANISNLVTANMEDDRATHSLDTLEDYRELVSAS